MTSRRSSGLRALLAVAILALAPAVARADDDVGVVVSAEAMIQPQLFAQLETWLRMHGHEVVSTPLPADAVAGLIDCFVIEDQNCARNIIDKRAKTDSIVFAQATVATGANGADRAVTISIYWIDKGKAPRTE